MISQCEYSNLIDFLIKHKAQENQTATHTRIGKRDLNIYGGSYVIPKEELHTFYDLYYKHVFVDRKLEYLTEIQTEDSLENNGPLLIDLDFQYDYAVTERQHTKEFITDILNCVYLEELKKLFAFEDADSFDIFVMEKPHVNRVKDKNITKDGIHIIVAIQMDHTLQMMLREKVIAAFPDYCDLPITNSPDKIFDEGISQGCVGWQLYGSRKPEHDAYRMTSYFTATFSSSDDGIGDTFALHENDLNSFDLKNDFQKLSAQFTEHEKFKINPRVMDEYNAKVQSKNKNKGKKKSTGASSKKTSRRRVVLDSDESDGDDEEIDLEDITNKQMLIKAVNNMVNSLTKTNTANNYAILEAHQYAQILPAKYYEPGSHCLNRQVAFALKNTSEKLFLSWIMLRSNASDFDYATIVPLHECWKKFNKGDKGDTGVTKRSLLYWAKQDAYEEFEKIKNNTISAYIDIALKSLTEYDCANVLHQMFKDRYVCVDINNKTWFMFKNHRWIEDQGLTLRNLISKDMHDLFQAKLIELSEIQTAQNAETPLSEAAQSEQKKKINTISQLSLKFKKTTDKNNIMREAMEIFYDKDFVASMDSNRHLMCFTNGVLDIKTKMFRQGYPSDYITKCTNIPYKEYSKIMADASSADYKHMQEVVMFMKQLFPIEELHNYMWDHLASSLIGENVNQYFNIYRGSGSNGKSLLVDLMTIVLGEYKGILPITLITDNRGKVGGTCSELIQLKGCRYAVMQEPKKDMTLNEGIMKEITGEKFMQGRELFKKSEVFAIQFQPVVCTNSLFRVESNDDGTWRRMKIVDFLAKFVDAGEEHTDDTPYVFVKDKGLKDKLPIWAPVFASLLVDIVCRTQGLVKDCDMVVASTMKYRHGQDHISGFIKDNVIRVEGGKLKKTTIWDAFKHWMQENQGGCKLPKGSDLYDYMDKKFGKYTSKDGWKGIDIIEPEETNILDDL